MTPRTILYLTPSSRLLGARRSLLQLAANLDPERYRPVVAVQTDGDLVGALREAGVETHIQFLGWWRKGRYMLQRPFRVRQLAGLARKVGADLIHCNEFFPCPYAVRAAARAGGLPVVSHMRLSITPRRIKNYDLRRTDRVVCVSQAAARDFEVWDDWRERIEVIYNGVDLDEYACDMSRSEARAKWDIPADAFVVGLFGLLSPRKRQDLLIEAAARARAAGLENLVVLIVGSPGKSNGEYAEGLATLIKDKGLETTVRMIPFQQEILDLYRACDVNALISNDEGFGRTVIEAGALGVPSIGARVGGIPELIEDGETGLVIPADDDGAELSKALIRLASDPEATRRMGQAAREHVVANFSIERHVESVMSLYDRLIPRA